MNLDKDNHAVAAKSFKHLTFDLKQSELVKSGRRGTLGYTTTKSHKSFALLFCTNLTMKLNFISIKLPTSNLQSINFGPLTRHSLPFRSSRWAERRRHNWCWKGRHGGCCLQSPPPLSRTPATSYRKTSVRPSLRLPYNSTTPGWSKGELSHVRPRCLTSTPTPGWSRSRSWPIQSPTPDKKNTIII